VGSETNNWHTPPELVTFHLQGNCYNHPEHDDGKRIRTSAIVDYDFLLGLVITNNRKYKLGEVCSLYEKKFPDAMRRFIDSFKNKKLHPDLPFKE